MKLIHILVTLLSTSSICSAPVDQNTTTPAAAAPPTANPSQGNQQQQPPAGAAQPANSGKPGAAPGSSDNKQDKPADANTQANKDKAASGAMPISNTIPYDRIQAFFKQLGNADSKQFKKLVDDIIEQTKKSFLDFNNIMLQFNKLEPEKKKLVVLWASDVANQASQLSGQDPSYYATKVDYYVNQLHTALKNEESATYGQYLNAYFAEKHSKNIDNVGHPEEDNGPRRFAFFSSLYKSVH
ncbi:hypothetical protein CONCODRAFT_77068 [Conidiobolus coronatus NRRL 28638]|uniref:Uncharacterized protein n=1 Tax=Conidiobolus coronatus (strain ATCC 28846 / CBS 209.66 / NRRL 28638) TaxID=796925 RepID=A0A137PGL4_CONC2|nr:hypothetical protein CONCODRAFT_77068 [Conidiobolus coronatus NRRL 28638]|eukprot:KXN74081.1 hypothetical protein CONCODRAFT_77068 [Conidiobolus coronatus NRRL 28638]